LGIISIGAVVIAFQLGFDRAETAFRVECEERFIPIFWLLWRIVKIVRRIWLYQKCITVGNKFNV
jgi:hypothetical protein